MRPPFYKFESKKIKDNETPYLDSPAYVRHMER